VSISFRLGRAGYDASVLGRHGSDFDDDDLVVAGEIQRALIGLDRHTTAIQLLRRQAGPLVDPDVGLAEREVCVLALTPAVAPPR
jgi:hypothetical protein